MFGLVVCGGMKWNEEKASWKSVEQVEGSNPSRWSTEGGVVPAGAPMPKSDKE
ncbi:hypothetical protein L195_g036625 [Trifolium pratense]|uniref:Uncharacterized protein n=1 Tax=Trifolium pratense TaxID=57577 RepID=A0A2K3LQ22_TRIPR|nr:hypothetical protein L195_g036625 [Trifolium pratense]